MLSGTTPFNSTDPADLLNEQLTGKIDFSKSIWKEISRDAQDFIAKCCNLNPEKRMTVDEALAHPWIVNECGRSNHDLGEQVKQTLSRTAQDGGSSGLPVHRDFTPGERELSDNSAKRVRAF